MPERDWTVIQVLDWTAKRLADAGSLSARLDADLLLAHALGIQRIKLYLEPGRLLSRDELERFKALAKRRLDGEPVAHLTGRKEFWKLSFATPPGVFVPRPETELVVEEALAFARRAGARTVLDLCTGCGPILVSLLAEMPELVGVGVDLSEPAISAACENAQSAGVTERCTLVARDVIAFVRETSAVFDIVTCNPPYVASGDWPRLSPAITRHEPRCAVDGGGDGLDFLRSLLPLLPRAVLGGGMIAIEYGGNEQTGALCDLVRASGFTDVRSVADLARIDRVVVGFRASS